MTSQLYIDENLAAPPLAQALRAAGYNVVTKGDIRDFDDLLRVEDDKHIIPWLTDHAAIWVHADDRAKVEHAILLKAGRVRTIWVYRPGGKLSLRQQLRVLAYSLPTILDRFQTQRRYQHYEIRLLGDRPESGIRIKDLSL